MKNFKVSLVALAILVAAVSAYTTAPRETNPNFAVFGNIEQEAAVASQEDFSSQGEQVATKSSRFTTQELNALAQEHCPAPNNIPCLAEVNAIDGQQDPEEAAELPLSTRAGTYE
jgi:hypothetical protein